MRAVFLLQVALITGWPAIPHGTHTLTFGFIQMSPVGARGMLALVAFRAGPFTGLGGVTRTAAATRLHLAVRSALHRALLALLSCPRLGAFAAAV